MEPKIRGRFHRNIKPLTKLLAAHGIKPNVITSSSLLLMIPASYFLIKHEENAFIILFILASFFDALDGAIAENENMKTKFGAFFDAFADRSVEGILYLSLAIAYNNLAILSFITLILSYLVSYTAAWEKELKKVGIGKRFYRLIVFILSFIFKQLFYGLVIISILALITIIQRILYISKNYKEL